MRSIKKKEILPLIICLLIPLLAGVIGSFFTTPEIGVWYSSLVKPSFTPPSWVFGPVWAFLYFLMGLALFLIWQSRQKKNKKVALIMFFLQLAFNVFWSFLFFHSHLLLWSLLEILVLLNLIALTINSFGKISPKAAWLLLPYWAWVVFATFLNYGIWHLNW